MSHTNDMDAVYRQHARTVYKFLLSQCHDPGLAEELTQETFYQAVRSIDKFDGTCKISVWLCQIAKHLWYQHLRKHQREVPLPEEGIDMPVPSAEEETIADQGRLELLRRVHDLPEPGREVVYLRVFGGLSFREIGDVLGKTETWARVTFYRSKENCETEGIPMKNDLTCAVVADLLPSYVEGLTSDETNRAVEAHVAGCPACAAKLAAMRGPETEAAVDVVPEVDYLKKVKKRTGKKVLLAVLCTVAVIVLGIAAKVFVIGSPAQPEGLAVVGRRVNEENIMDLEVTTPWSGNAYHSWKVETHEGVVNIRARQVLVSPLFSSGSSQLEIPMDGVKEVYLCGRLIWQNGTAINQNILRLYETRTPYVGDAAALGQMAAVMDISNLVGDYTMELRTSEQPYDWILRFPNKLTSPIETLMPYFGIQMLALVENLDQVTWVCPGAEGHSSAKTLTVDAVNDILPEWVAAYNRTYGTDWTAKDSVKDYGSSAAEFQQLISILGHRHKARRMGVDDTSLLADSTAGLYG